MRIDVGPECDVATLVRAATGESVVLVIDPGLEPVMLAMAIACIGPLAIERAPAVRVNAVTPATGADRGAVDAAVVFLESARSTTGQILAVG